MSPERSRPEISSSDLPAGSILKTRVTISARIQIPAIPKTSAGIPIASCRIGKKKTPIAAPSLAAPAANPWPAARISWGKIYAGRAYVVALGPAFMKKLKIAKPTKTRPR